MAYVVSVLNPYRYNIPNYSLKIIFIYRKMATRIDWSDFIRLRDDNGTIKATMCTNCEKIVRTCSSSRFQMHRYICIYDKYNCFICSMYYNKFLVFTEIPAKVYDKKIQEKMVLMIMMMMIVPTSKIRIWQSVQDFIMITL